MGARMVEQRNVIKAEQTRGLDLLHFKPPPPGERLDAKDKRFVWYEINGKRYPSGKRNTCPPEQSPASHWLCQVNGLTGRYNIVNNLPQDDNIVRQRNDELTRMRTERQGSFVRESGDVQPQQPITCHEMRKFVPVRQNKHLGVAERHHMLFS